MDWVELYIEEVIKHVPAGKRDELAESLRQEIEATLPADATEAEVKQVLGEMGHPAVVAARDYGGQYVIGPTLFPQYVSLLKLVVPIVLAMVFVGLVLASIPTFSGPVLPTLGTFLTNVFGVLWNVGIQLIFWITLVFFLMERYGGEEVKAMKMKWDVNTLRERERGGRISKWDAGIGIFFTAVWFGVYVSAERLIGIYESTSSGFTMMTPVFNQTFLFNMIGWFLIIILLQVGLGLWKWVKGRWSYALASYNLVYNLASATFIIWMASSPRLFDTRFLAWVETNVPASVSLTWVFGLVVAITMLAAVFDSIDGFRKARKTPRHGERTIAHI
ncbi:MULTISPECIES: hypothetical protein [Exiguobacterium]|uniref:hypothetical protein n=1 Tax=Exiguobacterium TaxID=33986 RepID=UPI001BEBA62E|nr:MULTISPECIES: hypothetical protein [Exiguobacterium]MCT4784472.1 hypothetical protein [Exiguobacterium himgiriensis]